MQYIEKLPIVAVEESSAEEKDGTSGSSCVRVLSFNELFYEQNESKSWDEQQLILRVHDSTIDATMPMDVESAAAVALEALLPPPVPPSTVFPEVEVASHLEKNWRILILFFNLMLDVAQRTA